MTRSKLLLDVLDEVIRSVCAEHKEFTEGMVIRAIELQCAVHKDSMEALQVGDNPVGHQYMHCAVLASLYRRLFEFTVADYEIRCIEDEDGEFYTNIRKLNT